MESPEKRNRKAKTTQQQFQLFLNELRENPHFRENKFNAGEPTASKTAWCNLTSKLNASGGPVKDVTAWKKTFSDWKSAVRKRARILQNSMKETGNVGAPEKPLTDLEEMLLDLTGKVVVYGLNNVPDIGWENKENEKTKPAVLVVTSAEPIPGTTGKGKSCLYHIPSSTLTS
ncbi:hypothetical protein MTP99_002742 [Tenebrio molitor]|nr:hypothetical protein MTP99_002742 [Tenebrio molitor]